MGIPIKVYLQCAASPRANTQPSKNTHNTSSTNFILATTVIGDSTKVDKTNNFSTTLSGVNSVAISPDGMTLVSGSQDQTIKIWQLSER